MGSNIQKSSATAYKAVSAAFALIAAISTAVAVWKYLDSASGISGSAGCLLVGLGTAALLIAACIIAVMPNGPRWIFITLSLLAALDIVLTAIASYFLDSYLLVGLMALAAVALVVMASWRADNQAHTRQEA